jgi:hypothetical protein
MAWTGAFGQTSYPRSIMCPNLLSLSTAASQKIASLPPAFRKRSILLLLLVTMPMAVDAQYTYSTNNGTITITKYTGPGGTVVIPATIAGLRVTTIGSQAFGYSASLTNVMMPNSLTNIGVGAFTDCTGLMSVTIGNSVPSIGDQVFFNCTSLAGVTIPSSVTNIGFQAFYQCSGLTSVTLPSSLTSIGSESFSWCTKLTSVTIPSGVSNIGDFAFDSCIGLSAITVDALSPFYSGLAGVLFNKTQTALIQCPGAKAGTYAVPNGVTSIGSSAFRNCNSLTNVTIPNSVTNIGDSAFGSSTSLSAITVDPLNSFYSSLAGVLFNKTQTTLIQCPGAITGTFTVPASVTSIVSTAFIGCRSLTGIMVDPLNSFYSSLAGALFDKAQGTLIQFPAGKTGAYSIPSGVTNIGDYAFAACAGLTNVLIPNGAIDIGVGAFTECANLGSIAIPDSVISIGSEAFEACTKMTSLTIGNSVTTIGTYSFYNCTSLTNLTIPNNVTDIADRAFEACTSLTSVTVGNSVTNIGSLAFGFCANLTSVYFKGNAPTVDSAAFGNDVAMIYYLAGTAGWGVTLDGLPTALWNPRIQTGNASFGLKTNRFGFTIAGITNSVFVVEACTNLAKPGWSALQTNTLAGGSTYFSDAQWTNHPVRFYRILLP